MRRIDRIGDIEGDRWIPILVTFGRRQVVRLEDALVAVRVLVADDRPHHRPGAIGDLVVLARAAKLTLEVLDEVEDRVAGSGVAAAFQRELSHQRLQEHNGVELSRRNYADPAVVVPTRVGSGVGSVAAVAGSGRVGEAQSEGSGRSSFHPLAVDDAGTGSDLVDTEAGHAELDLDLEPGVALQLKVQFNAAGVGNVVKGQTHVLGGVDPTAGGAGGATCLDSDR